MAVTRRGKIREQQRQQADQAAAAPEAPDDDPGAREAVRRTQLQKAKDGVGKWLSSS